MLLLPSLICQATKNQATKNQVTSRSLPGRLSGTRQAVALLALVASSLVGLSGCASSQDKSEYISTIYRPTTVGILDTVTDELIWKMDVPVEHALEIDMDRVNEVELFKVNQDMPATDMTWELRDRWTRALVAEGKFKLPAPHGVMIMLDYRPAPEEPLASPHSVVPVTGTAAGKSTGEMIPDMPVDAIDVDTLPAGVAGDSGGIKATPTAETMEVQEAADAMDAEAEATSAESSEPMAPAATPADGGNTTPAPAEESDPLLDALDMDGGK